MIRILVVEDDEKLNQIICTYLTNNHYQARGCKNPVEAYDLLSGENYDLIISDIMMPKISGFDFAREIRQRDPAIPILFITALDDLSSKQKGFYAGIDDYMVKPIDMDEMVLRVGALLRRARIKNENRLEIGDLVLVRDEMAAYVDGEEVAILPREFNLLYKLLSHPKKIFTRSELMDEYWGMTNDTGLRTVDVYITRLRRAFAHCKSFEIVTVHGFGYKAVLK
ncbi:MAG TPA: response regulator transcription factor [Candidatus Egerieimonas intestinavium]|uniref:Heme response regulator HssR n=1 Tax=Candidatus Egerieimonas intestinavium TaxID=2840777 RepID=A0A9D1JEY7_9FIRM|nr:response regulator transcription factor [Candidatus Egerieimonas intestinavium]